MSLPPHTRSKSEMIMLDKIEEEAYTTLGGSVRPHRRLP
jgi:hypothetical protein